MRVLGRAGVVLDPELPVEATAVAAVGVAEADIVEMVSVAEEQSATVAS